MRSPYEYIAEAINRKPFLIAGLVVAVIIIAMYGASMTSMKTGTDTYLYTDKPVGSLLVHYTDTFGSDSEILLIEGADVTTPDVLKYLDTLEGSIRDQKYVSSVTGLVDFLKSANGGVLPQNKADIDKALNSVSSDYLELLLPSKTMTLVSIPLETGLSEDSKDGVVSNLDSVISFSNPPAGISVTATGNPAFAVDMKSDIMSNMTTLIGLAMVLMIVAMVFLFGHVRYRMLPVFIVFCGIVLTFGVMGFAGISISSVVVAAFPVLIGIGIDYAIQFQSRFDEEIRKKTMKDAVFTTITSSGPAILLAMTATSLGFVALSLLAPSPMVADFGTICIVGIMCCYVCAMVIVPTFSIIVKYKPKNGLHGGPDGRNHPDDILIEGKSSRKVPLMGRYDIFLGSIAGKIAKHPVPLILIFAMLAVVGMQLDGLVIIDTDEDSMVSQDMPAMISMNKLTSVIGSTDTITAYIKADSIVDPETLKWIDEFSDYELEKQNDLTGATSIATYFKLYNNGAIPANEADIKRVWALIPDSYKDKYVNGNTETVIEFSMEDISIPAAQELVEDMKKDLDWYGQHPGMTAAYTGSTYMFTDLINSISDLKNPMTYLGFALIFVFLLLVYRKFSAVSPLVPIIMIVGWNGLIMYSLGLTYSLLTATLGAMTIGVASEYTILIMERYQEEKEKGNDMISSIQVAIQKIGTAISVSGLTTVFGFSALLLSTSPIIQNFGLVTVITVGFSLIGAIMVMPAVISIFESFSAYMENRRRKNGCNEVKRSGSEPDVTDL
ncbi:hydrophobe/amphiphile efflux-3 (HAE3) family protein [Methanomicrobium sp. W14]|uniref:efflux RND transporter permease subunit n=1 Tax=Methanomicrobium sp. W14 TaxID=2817839 RepID=UPI001AE25F70|nr:hydrophobe/amphiphile efflux-3 (HAE3) family transporter [Methanomicrobium sp. W14]MBP2134466.1 hydrophobe/amphiphile efflux-3 (HAE3) family protein [Methanomicrobium sp. W14]